ncbi:MAG TPA: Hpt domain-containing protein, partial [Vicinamibacteria bacterium]
MSDFQVSPELLSIYLEDARGHLEMLDHSLLALERDGFDPEVVSAVLGPLHTLKGNSGMMGFTGIKEYVHRLEDVFVRIHDGALALIPTVFDRLFAGATGLRDAIEQACRSAAEVRDLEDEKAELDVLLSAPPPSPNARPAMPPPPPPRPGAEPGAPP